MQSSSSLVIDLSVLYNNLKRLSHRCGQLMIMVKANAYGSDPLFLSKFVQAAKMPAIAFIGVSHVSEGVALREAGITLPIFVISTPSYEADKVAAFRLTAAISSLQEAESLNLAGQKYGLKLPVHLHLDTGMNRFGVSIEESVALYEAIQKAPYLQLEGAMTHFAASDASAFDSFSHEQIALFKQFLDQIPTSLKWIHASNSGAAARFDIPFCNLARIGLGVMGYGPCVEGMGAVYKMITQLSSISSCKKGETVGYNRSYKIQKEKGTIGVIPVGYYDSFHRCISGKGYVLIRGKKAPMVGMICMDFMMIDLTEIPEAQVGDEVVLFGPELSPETVAEWAQTDVRELLVSIPPRVKRIWTNFPLIMHATRKDDETSAERLPNPFFPIEKDPSSR